MRDNCSELEGVEVKKEAEGKRGVWDSMRSICVILGPEPRTGSPSTSATRAAYVQGSEVSSDAEGICSVIIGRLCEG